MVVPQHIRIRVGGTLYNDASWSIGVNFARPGLFGGVGLGEPLVQDSLEGIRDAVRALNDGNIFPGALRTPLSTSGAIKSIRVSRIGTDGKEVAVALQEGFVVLGTGEPMHSAQTAIALSLRTGRPGASYRGRVYLPGLRMPLSAGRIDGGNRTTLVEGFAQWLRDVAGSLPGGILDLVELDPVVVSSVKEVATPVTTVAVGDRLDTQRRRAEGQDEAYSVAPVPD